ncbi:hypothetical protein [Desulfosporosinus sp. OT]|uniref:hypothetical protein n=1 Tax=Desulfosporosinus sp. OT TaxID=913865 RepID=UPI000223A493|nr:hypothetical protein [Desulfosporosinus sp. OT]EGW37840.1 hypothetical protein DOT_4248 [Desulfosporosinus sp. OT]
MKIVLPSSSLITSRFLELMMHNSINSVIVAFLGSGACVLDTSTSLLTNFPINLIGCFFAESLVKLIKVYEPFGLPMNDIANLCELVGADIQDVAKRMGFDAE